MFYFQWTTSLKSWKGDILDIFCQNTPSSHIYTCICTRGGCPTTWYHPHKIMVYDYVPMPCLSYESLKYGRIFTPKRKLSDVIIHPWYNLILMLLLKEEASSICFNRNFQISMLQQMPDDISVYMSQCEETGSFILVGHLRLSNEITSYPLLTPLVETLPLLGFGQYLENWSRIGIIWQLCSDSSHFWLVFRDIVPSHKHRCKCRADSRLAPSQREAALQSNAVSHWLGANLEAPMQMMPQSVMLTWLWHCKRRISCAVMIDRLFHSLLAQPLLAGNFLSLGLSKDRQWPLWNVRNSHQSSELTMHCISCRI